MKKYLIIFTLFLGCSEPELFVDPGSIRQVQKYSVNVPSSTDKELINILPLAFAEWEYRTTDASTFVLNIKDDVPDEIPTQPFTINIFRHSVKEPADGITYRIGDSSKIYLDQRLHGNGLYSIALHEVGHAMRLKHLPYRYDIMSPITRVSSLQNEDIVEYCQVWNYSYFVPPQE